MQTIISSLISAAVTLIVCVYNNKVQAEKSRALIEYKLSELEKKVDKHNNLIERTYALEKDSARTQDELKRVNHRLNDLEEDDRK